MRIARATARCAATALGVDNSKFSGEFVIEAAEPFLLTVAQHGHL